MIYFEWVHQGPIGVQRAYGAQSVKTKVEHGWKKGGERKKKGKKEEKKKKENTNKIYHQLVLELSQYIY